MLCYNEYSIICYGVATPICDLHTKNNKSEINMLERLRKLNVHEIKLGLQLRSQVDESIVHLSCFEKTGSHAYEVCLDELTINPDFIEFHKAEDINFSKTKSLYFSYDPFDEKIDSLRVETVDAKAGTDVEETVYDDLHEKAVYFDKELQARLNIELNEWFDKLIIQGHHFSTDNVCLCLK